MISLRMVEKRSMAQKISKFKNEDSEKREKGQLIKSPCFKERERDCMLLMLVML